MTSLVYIARPCLKIQMMMVMVVMVVMVMMIMMMINAGLRNIACLVECLSSIHEALGSVLRSTRSMTACTCYPQDLEVEARGSGVQGYSWLNSESKAFRHSRLREILCQKQTNKNMLF